MLNEAGYFSREETEGECCGASDGAWKTSETALMKVANTALGWIEGREEKKELLVINFREKSKIRKILFKQQL